MSDQQNAENGQPVMLTGEAAMERFVHLYMSAFVSGAYSALATVGMPDERAERLADALAEGVREDRLSYESVRQEVVEALTGQDHGVRGWTLPPSTPPESGRSS